MCHICSEVSQFVSLAAANVLCKKILDNIPWKNVIISYLPK